jgi:hypothetical protein
MAGFNGIAASLLAGDAASMSDKYQEEKPAMSKKGKEKMVYFNDEVVGG